MTSVQEWSQITISALQSLWESFIKFLPSLIGALVIFVIGWFISVAIGRLVSHLLKLLKFNQIFERTSWKHALEKAEIDVDASRFVGAIVKWILVIVFLLASVEVLGLTQFAQFIKDVTDYLPNVLVAALIFVVTVIVVDIVEKLVRVGVEGLGVGYSKAVGAITKWTIWGFALLAILDQLGIAQYFLRMLFMGIVATITIAFGLAFGLAGKDAAGDVIREIREKLRKD